MVGGELGGRRFRAPSGRRTRPTREPVREAWFAALGPRVVDATVADLFAGSGALGIEALSRGAARVLFVERDARTLALLRRNLEELGLTGRARAVRRDVFAFLEADDGPWDLVLADPPYGEGLAERLVGRFRREPFARMLCLEHEAEALAEEGAAWRRRYGDSALSFFLAETGGPTGGE